MSLSLERLLGPAPSGTPVNHRGLRSADGITLRLLSNAQDDRLMLLSTPGRLSAEEAQAFNQTLWHHTLAHPTREGLRLSVVVPAGGTRVYLADVWPRHAVEPQALVHLLDDHTRRHRLWREALAAREPDDELGEDVDDDTDPHDACTPTTQETISPERFA